MIGYATRQQLFPRSSASVRTQQSLGGRKKSWKLWKGKKQRMVCLPQSFVNAIRSSTWNTVQVLPLWYWDFAAINMFVRHCVLGKGTIWKRSWFLINIFVWQLGGTRSVVCAGPSCSGRLHRPHPTMQHPKLLQWCWGSGIDPTVEEKFRGYSQFP